MSGGEAARPAQPEPTIVQWLLDTRPLWPVPSSLKHRESVACLKQVASRALSLLHDEEQTSALRYYQLKDAKMSLVSHLLKHHVISSLLRIPFSRTPIARSANHKPYYCPSAPSSSTPSSTSSSPSSPPNTSPSLLDFNISHQAGLVTCAATTTPGRAIGTDIVNVSERKAHDDRWIAEKGFFDYVDAHQDVFAPSEVTYLKFSPDHLNLEIDAQDLPKGGYARNAISRCQRREGVVEWTVGEEREGGDKVNREERMVRISASEVVSKKMRRFYALWCLREAFLKMTGEGLTGKCLRRLEFRGFKTPKEGDGGGLERGETVVVEEIWLEGKRVQGVRVEITALGREWMVATALRVGKDGDVGGIGGFPEWRELRLEDVLEAAERGR